MGAACGIYNTADIEWQRTYKIKMLSDGEEEERDQRSSLFELSASVGK
jgi:hypothetical protein